MRRTISMPYMIRILALLLSAALFFNSAGHTLAYIVTQTPSLINTFLSGLEPSGDLTIRKEVEHPFGDAYHMPGGMHFDFTVSLGADYAGKIVRTSQGDLTADENGTITVTVKPGEAVRLMDIREGTQVTVTEAPVPGFTAQDGSERVLTIREGENALDYINLYAPGAVTQPNLEVNGRKFLEGRKWREGDSFTFQLEYKLAGTDKWETLGTATVTYEMVEITDPDDPENTIWVEKPDFDRFSFTELVQSLTYDQAGIYSFRVSEVEGTVPGVTYDTVVSYFDVLVGDEDMDGYLEIQSVAGYQNATASFNDQTNAHRIDVTVNNIYAPEGTASVKIRIQKSVESLSGEEKAPAGFTFELYTEDGELVATSEQTSAAGETSLELTFDAEDAGKTYHYILKESNSGRTIQGMTFDDREYALSVSIVDNLDGTVSAYIYSTENYSVEEVVEEPEETEPEETTEPTEEPTQPTEETTEPTEEPTESTESTTAPTEETTQPTEEPTEPSEETTAPTEAETQPSQEPTLPAETETQPEESTAPVAEAQAPMVTEITVQIAGAHNHAIRAASAGEIRTFSEGTQSATIPEVEAIALISETETQEESATEPAQAGEEEPDTPAESAPAEEDRKITLVTVIPEDASDIYTVSFENSYDPEDTQARFDGTKKLSGRTLRSGEFRFDLYATGKDFTVTEEMKPVQSVSHDEEGSFSFAPITYERVGIYHYVVVENAEKALGGVTYDQRLFHVSVTVWDDGGELKTRMVTTDELGTAADIVFRNVYAAEKTSAIFGGRKLLNDAKPKADQFVFLLYPADEDFTIQGGALDTAANTANGSFSFAEIPYEDDGTYFYVIAEDDSGKEPGMTYDDTVYGVKVTVTDDGEGNLTASVSYWLGGKEVEEVLFRNYYTKPDESTETTEPTDSEETTEPTETETDSTETTQKDPTTKPKDSSTPQTGDQSHIREHIVTMFISLAVMLLLLPDLLRQRKARKKQ